MYVQFAKDVAKMGFMGEWLTTGLAVLGNPTTAGSVQPVATCLNRAHNQLAGWLRKPVAGSILGKDGTAGVGSANGLVQSHVYCTSILRRTA
jgi:hypothetical protein